MATNLARLRLDRNPAAFTVPQDIPESQLRLAGLLSSTFQRIDRAFRTLKVIVEGPDSDPNTYVDIDVVTGVEFSGGNLVVHHATIRVLKATTTANTTITMTAVDVHSGDPTSSSTTLTLPTVTIYTFGNASSGTSSTIDGTDCL